MTLPIHLTTPHMHGKDVQKLQSLMHAHAWYHDAIDGDYGNMTAQGVHRSKYWLGYRVPDQTAGALLFELLRGEKNRTPAMRVRVAIRTRKLKEKPLRVVALAWLSRHIGEKESPANSNRVPWASEWYGVIGPWCAMGASRAYVEAGSKSFRKGVHYSYVPYIVADARAGRNNLTLTSHPQPGDLVCYDWGKDGTADHVELFEAWIAGAEGTEFHAIGCNTSADDKGNQSNGGMVARRLRQRATVQAFVHVGR